jgi:hypothetical protein
MKKKITEILKIIADKESTENGKRLSGNVDIVQVAMSVVKSHV